MSHTWDMATYNISLDEEKKLKNIKLKAKMFEFGWLVNTLASQPIRTRASRSNIFVFMLRWPTFLTASIVLVSSLPSFHSYSLSDTRSFYLFLHSHTHDPLLVPLAYAQPMDLTV